ncbi:MAG: (Fe-S)-binding protein [Acidobacteria bacterium]|nr:(Fe-S)-binding protein [Acidobacteriota bacterium]
MKTDTSTDAPPPQPPTARPSRVQLFATCLVDRFFPGVGHATVAVLERAGVAVDVPADQTCCGQPALNGGFTDHARAMARHTIDVLSASPDPVVVPSGSCADMIVNHYPELLAQDAVYGPKARELASRTWELSQFIVDVLGQSDPGSRTNTRLAYHASCHGLRGLDLREAPRQLLGAATGGRCADLPDAETCCGFGGLFAIKMAPVSAAMLEAKIASIESSGAEAVVATDVSCLMHIGGGLRRRRSPVRIMHIAEVLAGSDHE